jgi:hypothetical protein
MAERGLSESVESWPKPRVTEIAGLGVGFLYVSGFYINLLFTRNLGISPVELVRLEYISIGAAFTLLTILIGVLPIGAVYLTYRIRKASGLPHLHIGAIGNSLNTILCLGFVLFLALFVTRYEWNLRLPRTVIGLQTFKSVAMTYSVLALCGMIIVPYLERILMKGKSPGQALGVYRFLVEPIRFGIVGVCIFLGTSCLVSIPWIRSLSRNGIYYVLVDVVMIGGVTAAALWMRHIHKVPGSWAAYGLISIGLVIIFYLASTSYVFGVYNLLPYNRGGRLPLTRAYIDVKEPQGIFTESCTVGAITVHGPLYIIEENEHTYFIAWDMSKWIDGFVPIHVIRKENVPYMYLERIEDGYPRVRRDGGDTKIAAVGPLTPCHLVGH